MKTASMEVTKDLEKQILGKIINEPQFFFDCFNFGLRPYMFRYYSDIYTEINKRVQNDEAYDLVSLGVKYPDKMHDLSDMVENAPITLNLKTSMKSLKFFAEQNRMKQLVSRFYKQIDEITIDGAAEIDKIKGKFIHEMTAKVDDLKSVKMDILIDKVTEDFQKRMDGETVYQPLNTGNHKLDQVLGMHCRGKYITIMAETGIGKSTVALDIACNMGKRGRKVLYFTQEMTNEELAEKAVLMRSSTDWNNFITGKMQGVQIDNWLDAARELRNLPIYLNYANADIDEIILESLSMIRREGIEAIFLDYIQQLECSAVNSHDPREVMIVVSKKIMRFALEQNIPVFVAAQLNRSASNAKLSSLINNVADSSSISKDTTYGLAVVTQTDPNGKEIDRFLYKTKGPRGRLTHLFFDKKSHRYSTDY
jgi:replicative DNA helicase